MKEKTSVTEVKSNSLLDLWSCRIEQYQVKRRDASSSSVQRQYTIRIREIQKCISELNKYNA